MSRPEEEERAIVQALNLLMALVNPQKTPSVPKAIREQARVILRHYPGPARTTKIFDMAAGRRDAR